MSDPIFLKIKKRIDLDFFSVLVEFLSVCLESSTEVSFSPFLCLLLNKPKHLSVTVAVYYVTNYIITSESNIHIFIL